MRYTIKKDIAMKLAGELINYFWVHNIKYFRARPTLNHDKVYPFVIVPTLDQEKHMSFLMIKHPGIIERM
jgi:hypothetical protein